MPRSERVTVTSLPVVIYVFASSSYESIDGGGFSYILTRALI